MCRSYYDMKAALGVQPASKFEMHICPNPHCSCVFPKLARAEWRKVEHCNSVCTHCKHGRRFLDRSGPPQPSKRYAILAHACMHAKLQEVNHCYALLRYKLHPSRASKGYTSHLPWSEPRLKQVCICRAWYFGVQRCLRRLLSDPDNLEDVCNRSARTTNDSATFYGSPQYKQLNIDCGGALDNKKYLTLLLSLGGDGVQLLNWGCRTATVIGLKCEDLCPERVQSGRAVVPLMVIEGPQEPSVLNHALAKAAAFFLQHCPSSDGKGSLHAQTSCNVCARSTHTLNKSLNPSHAPFRSVVHR
jgi:hypothetical protein